MPVAKISGLEICVIPRPNQLGVTTDPYVSFQRVIVCFLRDFST